MSDFFCSFSRPAPDVISLAHGAGGRVMHDLIQRLIQPLYAPGFSPDHDSALVRGSEQLAFTTDSYVVKPLVFPGGDIGKLAVYGTVNDLAMAGAKPLYISCSFILEEGLPFQTLESICLSIAEAARLSEISIVTGDTKVVGRGQADGIFINTAGIGSVAAGISVHPRNVRPEDILLLSGDIGRHGIAVMAARENMGQGIDLESDCAPLFEPVQSLINAGIRPKCLRDLTRGGLAAALHEISEVAKVGMIVDEGKVQVHEAVRSMCEYLGLDPIYVACEGRFLLVIAPEDVNQSLSLLKTFSVTQDAHVIGKVNVNCEVELNLPYGARRILAPLQGELLPRIC